MFTDEQKRIFGPYFNGRAEVFADPLRVSRRLYYMLDGDPNKVLESVHSEDAEVRFKAREKLIPAAIYALDMHPFDPESGCGAVEEDIFAALSAYLVWMDKKKVTGLSTQSSLRPSPVSQPPSAPSLITTPMSPYTLTSPDCGCKKRGTTSRPS